MATKSVTARLESHGLRLVAQTGCGHTIVMDKADGASGPRRPSCSSSPKLEAAMNIITILRKKRQDFASRRCPSGRRAISHEVLHRHG